MTNNKSTLAGKMTQYRWVICAMLFFATTVNYLDRQVLSLTWDEFIKPEFHWNEYHYGLITSIFSIVYAVCMLFAGRFIDWMGTKKGYLWAIGVWSMGACMHALCGIATEAWVGLPDAAALRAVEAGSALAATIAMVSMYFFIAARCILALGEAGNFPAAIKVTAEYFPKKDRAYATSIFNAGASIGALFAPLTIPLLAKAWGWEMAFIVIGAPGFVWMGFWVFMYKKPSDHPKVNAAELEYIEQDQHEVVDGETVGKEQEGEKISFWRTLSFKQTWAFAFGKFMTDGVWWFFLFWTPSYLNSQFGIKMSEGLGVALIFTLYAITMLSIYGGKLPTIIINKTGLNPYAARMRAMLIFAFIPLLVLLARIEPGAGTVRETCAAVLRFRTCFLWGVGAGIVLGVPLLILLGFYVGSLTSPYVFYGFVAGLIVGLPLGVRIFLRMMGDINALRAALRETEGDVEN